MKRRHWFLILILAMWLAPTPRPFAGCLVTLNQNCLVPGSVPSPSSKPPPQAPCLGDGSSGKRVQLFYGQVVGQADQSSSFVPQVRTSANYVNQAYQQKGNENVRWACASGSQTVIHVLVPTNTFPAAMDTLRALGYTSPDRIYTVLEAGSSPNGLVGQATVAVDDKPYPLNTNGKGPFYSIVWGADAGVLMHEEAHNMGAVQLSAPDSTGAWHVHVQHDTMGYRDGGPWFSSGGGMTPCQNYPLGASPTLAQLWDCEGDNYYNPSPSPGSYLTTHWNLYHSAYLGT